MPPQGNSFLDRVASEPGYVLKHFDWESGVLFSSIQAPLIATVVYLIAVFGIRTWSHKNISAWRDELWDSGIKRLVGLHNLYLASLSLFMVVGTIFASYERIQKEGYDWLFCENPKTKAQGPLFAWSYIYYLSKYYELLDTVFQLLRGRDPPHFFMHSFHHVVVLFMCYFWLEYKQSLQFLGLLFNAFVHVVMYFYYYLRACNINPSWKHWVTRLQIIQFVTSFLLLVYTVFFYVLPGKQSCAGLGALAFNSGFNAILLYLFFGVLRINTKREKKSDGRDTAGGKPEVVKGGQTTSGTGLTRRKSKKDI